MSIEKKLEDIAKKWNIPIVEDAAQGMGAYYKGLHSGSFGKIAAFSGHPLKNLGAIGDSGFIVTNSKELYDKIKLYRNHGILRNKKKHWQVQHLLQCTIL